MLKIYYETRYILVDIFLNYMKRSNEIDTNAIDEIFAESKEKED